MSITSDLQYHLTREAMERAAADRATTQKAREIHNALADRHADRVWSLNEGYSNVSAFPAVRGNLGMHDANMTR
jgi:hypothetical protein